LIILGLHLLAFYYVQTYQLNEFPTLAGLGMPLPLLHGPFLYLYTYQQTSARPFNKRQLLHFVPFILSYILFSKYFMLTYDQKIEVFQNQGKGFELQSMINLYAIYLSGITYVVLSLLRLFKYRRNMVQQFSNTEKINFNWLLYLICWMVIIWTVVMVMQDDKLIYSAASLFVLWIGYFGIKQVQVFTHPPVVIPVPDKNDEVLIVNEDSVLQEEIPGTTKYQKSTLSDEESEEIHTRLKNLMIEEKPYTDPDLTLDELAARLDVHPNYLSQVINSRENKSFYDLINEKRVDAFVRKISDPSNQQFTLLALALECGFNSKASFNRNFKKYTGYTPSEYMKLKPAA
jgi:AraC-like DNA-binding protein